MRTARTTTEGGLPRPGEYKERDATVLARVVALKRMAVNDLKAEWKTLFGTDAPNNSRGFLELRLAHRIQELTYGIAGICDHGFSARLALDLVGESIEKLGCLARHTAVGQFLNSMRQAQLKEAATVVRRVRTEQGFPFRL